MLFEGDGAAAGRRAVAGGTAGMARLLSRLTPLTLGQLSVALNRCSRPRSSRRSKAVALSIAGAVAMNAILAVNHRPGRYVGA